MVVTTTKLMLEWKADDTFEQFYFLHWGNSVRLFFEGGGAPKSLQMVTAAMKLKHAYSLEGKL